MEMLVLSAGLAAGVVGPTAGGAALAPRPLADGTFALPSRVLDDPNHAQWHSLLSPAPRRPLADCVWLAEQTD